MINNTNAPTMKSGHLNKRIAIFVTKETAHVIPAALYHHAEDYPSGRPDQRGHRWLLCAGESAFAPREPYSDHSGDIGHRGQHAHDRAGYGSIGGETRRGSYQRGAGGAQRTQSL